MDDEASLRAIVNDPTPGDRPEFDRLIYRLRASNPINLWPLRRIGKGKIAPVGQIPPHDVEDIDAEAFSKAYESLTLVCFLSPRFWPKKRKPLFWETKHSFREYLDLCRFYALKDYCTGIKRLSGRHVSGDEPFDADLFTDESPRRWNAGEYLLGAESTLGTLTDQTKAAHELFERLFKPDDRQFAANVIRLKILSRQTLEQVRTATGRSVNAVRYAMRKLEKIRRKLPTTDDNWPEGRAPVRSLTWSAQLAIFESLAIRFARE